jgi:hypothetical protein
MNFAGESEKDRLQSFEAPCGRLNESPGRKKQINNYEPNGLPPY